MDGVGGRQGGRPPERIRLPADELARAKESLGQAEEALGQSQRKLSASLGISPKTWRSYKGSGEPGPPPQIVFELDRRLADESDDWHHGQLASVWGLESEKYVQEFSPQPKRRLLLFAGLGLLVALSVVAVLAWVLDEGEGDPTDVASIEVFNKVVFDETQMREDTPAYLTTSADCISFTNCGVGGTEFRSGDELNAVCQMRGLEVTNRFGEVSNPGNFESDIWYGIQHGSAFGYISEVWIHERHRGGLGLRRCEPTG